MKPTCIISWKTQLFTMAYITQEISQVSEGFSKKIEAGAEDLIFDLTQRGQYTYPVKSMIREVVSNGLDSVREKSMARSILTGKAKVEDYYAQKEGDLYKDSRFDPTYYTLSRLSKDDSVYVIYHDGGATGKDEVKIRDFGVGLGGRRLEGYFNLGFSTKRLNTVQLGKYGLGSKSPLSTNAPYFTMRTRHDGREFAFNVYMHKIESITPAFNLETGRDNPVWEFHTDEGIKPVSYLITDEPNMVEISVQVKKHHKEQYLDAVKSQLLYFPNVKCFIEGAEQREIPVSAEILYQDADIVMAADSIYSKPHMILNGVNYGYIDFRELELEEKLGNIGIKVDPSTVDVTPSRESLIWNDRTREAIVEKFNKVVGIAESLINKELVTNDFLEWIKGASTVAASTSRWSERGGIMGRLSQIIDVSKIDLSFPGDPRVRYNNMLAGMDIKGVELQTERKGSRTIRKYRYNDFWRSCLSRGLPIYLQVGSLSPRRNKYMLDKIHPDGFIMIRLHRGPKMENGKIIEEIKPEDIYRDEVVEAEARAYNKNHLLEDKYLDRVKTLVAHYHNLLFGSKNIRWYSDVEVPEDYRATDKEEEEVVEDVVDVQELKGIQLSREERRKAEGKTLVRTPQISGASDRHVDESWAMIEVPIALIDEWSSQEIYWGNEADNEELIAAAELSPQAFIPIINIHRIERDSAIKTMGYTWPGPTGPHVAPFFVDNPQIMLIKVAQPASKYYRDFKHITRFFKQIEGKTITMSSTLIRWNTARLLKQEIGKLNFMRGLRPFSEELHAKFLQIQQYADTHWRETKSEADLVEYLDNVGNLQKFVRENPEDHAAIARYVKQLFDPQDGIEIADGRAIDMEIYDLYQQLLDWSEPVRTMLNMVAPLTQAGQMTGEQEDEIRRYFQYRNCPLNFSSINQDHDDHT